MSQIERCFDILEILFETPKGLALSEISARADIPAATTHRILGFMKSRGYVSQDAHETYRLSLLLPSMGAHFFAGTGFSELLQPHLDRLAAETGEHIRLSAVVDGQLIWVLRAVVSSHGLQYRGALDTKIVPHITASGKMWLSSLSDEEAVRVVSHWRIERSRDYAGPNAVTSIQGLLSDLETVRRDGYAAIVEEAEVGVCAVAVGIPDPAAAPRLRGVLSLAAPTARLSREQLQGMVPRMRGTAQEIQKNWSLWASVNAGGAETLLAV